MYDCDPHKTMELLLFHEFHILSSPAGFFFLPWERPREGFKFDFLGVFFDKTKLEFLITSSGIPAPGKSGAFLCSRLDEQRARMSGKVKSSVGKGTNLGRTRAVTSPSGFSTKMSLIWPFCKTREQSSCSSHQLGPFHGKIQVNIAKFRELWIIWIVWAGRASVGGDNLLLDKTQSSCVSWICPGVGGN